MQRLPYAILFLALFIQCSPLLIEPSRDYTCRFPLDESLVSHPLSSDFQAVLAENSKNDIAGGVALVKDQSGFWMGASGYADLESKDVLKICHPFLIASITKMFTATCILQETEKGNLDIDTKIVEYLSEAWIKDISNTESATLKQLLNHTSGIPDFYDNTRFELTRLNRENNDFSTLDVLAYAEGLDAYFPAGTEYEYSNTNYLLLGLILEEVTGENLADIYKSHIFDPLGIKSGYYSTDEPFPSDLIKGYGEPLDGELIETEWLYVDEMGTADGGIAIHIYDLFLFVQGLFEGDLVLPETKAEMLTPISLTEDDSETILGHQRNGLGVEIYDTPKGGEGYGHTGGIDGFLSYAMYFPTSKSYVIYLQNTASYDNEDRINLINELTELMKK